MRPFDEIFAIAAARHGGPEALEAKLAGSRPAPVETVAATPDHRILAEMARCVFQAGFSWKVIEAKWPGFEAAFDGFDPGVNAAMSEERFDALVKDARIIRNAAKIRAVQRNAGLLVELAAERGSAARFLAEWPDADYVGLVELLKKRGDRLAGLAGMRVLRAIGRPAFILTESVVTALIRDGAVDGPPSSKRAMAEVQAAFNAWSAESGRDLTTLSRVLAMSVDLGGPGI